MSLPTSSVSGIDLDALATVLARERVGACWLMPTFQNPTGALMPDASKRDLVALLARHQVPLIEDDVYGELYFGAARPKPAKAFDENGLVLHCSSFSKSLAPGYRVGWVAAGRHAQALEAWGQLRQRSPESFGRVAPEFAACAVAAGQGAAARDALRQLFDRQPSVDLLRALAALDGTSAGQSPQLVELLHQQPSLSAALELLELPCTQWTETARQHARDAVAQAARPLQRYRCAACGFESQRHFWQCPGCLSWDSFPPLRLEEQ